MEPTTRRPLLFVFGGGGAERMYVTTVFVPKFFGKSLKIGLDVTLLAYDFRVIGVTVIVTIKK